METAMTTNQPLGVRLRRFFVREDAVYDAYAAKYQAKTPVAKATGIVRASS